MRLTTSRLTSAPKLTAMAILIAATCCRATQLPQAPSPTTTFSPAEPIYSADTAIDFEAHASPRFFDWNGDGALDLIVGDANGQAWLFANSAGKGSKPKFATRHQIAAGSRSQWGKGYTGVLFQDVNNDSLPDLIVAHSNNLVSIHYNAGTLAEPKFATECIEIRVQDGCHGRVDMADWDGDGCTDLVTGSFGGELQWHRNLGSKHSPKFASAATFHDIRIAYNAHPRIVDFDHDGQLDLLLGVNWGTVTFYRNRGSVERPELTAGNALAWADDGKNLNLRKQNGDDTTPELADLNADGIVDLISGGHNGKLFVMHGVGPEQRMLALTKLLNRGGDNSATYLEREPEKRAEVFKLLRALQSDLEARLLDSDACEALFMQLCGLAAKHPELLQRRKHDLSLTPHAPMLAAQCWVIAKSAVAKSGRNLARLADAFGFAGGYRDLLLDLGVIFYDNNTATPRQLQLMHQLLNALPRNIWDVELISVADWIGKGREQHPVKARTAINIFGMNLGVPENSFPNDAPRPGITDVYLICLAHEIAHNMLDTVGRDNRPNLFERKFEGLAFAAGKDVVYRTPKSQGIDFEATKVKFQKAGAWNGDNATWRDAWKTYFKDKEQFDRAYARGNVQFFLDAPQEAFSTLANQYVADSDLMLEFAKVRWDASHRSTVHQFLLIADYFSDNELEVPFYVLPRGGALKVSTATLTRDQQGRIKTLRSGNAEASFDYESAAGAIVKNFTYRKASK